MNPRVLLQAVHVMAVIHRKHQRKKKKKECSRSCARPPQSQKRKQQLGGGGGSGRWMPGRARYIREIRTKDLNTSTTLTRRRHVRVSFSHPKAWSGRGYRRPTAVVSKDRGPKGPRMGSVWFSVRALGSGRRPPPPQTKKLGMRQGNPTGSTAV